MDKVKPYVIGVDLGGTNTVFGVVNARGEVVAENSIKTQQYKTAEAFVEAGVACLKPLLAQIGGADQVQGMGIGAPNGNYYNGTIEFAPNLPWAHEGIIPLADMFNKATGIPVKLTNDAMVSCSTDTTDLQASWVTSSWTAQRKVAAVVADVLAASRLIAPLQVWPVQLAKSLPTPSVPLCFATNPQRRLSLSTSASQPARATRLPTKSSSSPARCWARLVPTSQPSPAPKHSSSSVDCARQATSS